MRQPLVLDCRTLGVEQLQYELDQRYREGWRVVAAWPGLLFLERGVPAVATAAAVYGDDLHAACS